MNILLAPYLEEADGSSSDGYSDVYESDSDKEDELDEREQMIEGTFLLYYI